MGSSTLPQAPPLRRPLGASSRRFDPLSGQRLLGDVYLKFASVQIRGAARAAGGLTAARSSKMAAAPETQPGTLWPF